MRGTGLPDNSLRIRNPVSGTRYPVSGTRSVPSLVMTVRIFPDADALADAAADVIAQQLSTMNGRRDVGLAGGSTPTAAYRRLATQPAPWNEVHAWMTDERHVPLDHLDSNAGMARRTLIDHVPATLHTVPWHESAVDAAAAFERHLGSFLHQGPEGLEPWLVVLGIGDDGHTASLFPGSLALDEAKRDFVAVDVPGRGWRFTATLPLLARARSTVFLVSGSGKANILAEVLTETCELPAARVARAAKSPLWLVDRDAARLL